MEKHRDARAPSMADVAAAAGVSTQTVSRVMRDHPYVTADKRARVLDAVEALGYRMNAAAKALSSGRTRIIGVVSMSTDSYAGAMTQASIERAAGSLGYAVVGAQISDVDPTAISAALDRLEHLGSEGIILAVPLRATDRRIDAVTARLPAVTIGGSPAPLATSITVNQREVARIATAHLLGLGHGTVWHVSGPDDWVDSIERTAGWVQALQDAGREVPPVVHGDWSPESGYQAGLALPEEVRAVFVASDEMAFGLVRGLHESGRRVPHDVSVVSVDDVPLAAYCTPALTTVAQPFADLGRAAVDSVIARIENRADPSIDLSIESRLVVRASTASPA